MPRTKTCQLEPWTKAGGLRAPSASKLLTTSILLELSQRGISANLCVHFSGASVFMHSSVHGTPRSVWARGTRR